MVPCLQIERQSWIPSGDRSGIRIIILVEDDHLQIGLDCMSAVLVRRTCNTTIQTLPPCHLLTAGWLGRESQIVQAREPALRNAALRLNGKGIAMSMPEIDQVTKWLDGRIAARE